MLYRYRNISATVRALTDKGHKVTVIAIDSCKDLVTKSMPNIFDYHEMVLSHDFSASSSIIEVIPLMDEAFRVNFTIGMFDQLDDFIAKSPTGSVSIDRSLAYLFFIWSEVEISQNLLSEEILKDFFPLTRTYRLLGLTESDIFFN